MITYHFIIKGKVQGVGYRITAYMNAVKLDLVGTVRNLENGDVEIFVQGEKNLIENYKKYLEKGSGFSKVSSLEETITEHLPFKSFKILY